LRTTVGGRRRGTCYADAQKFGREYRYDEDTHTVIAATRPAERRGVVPDGAYRYEARAKGIDAVL